MIDGLTGKVICVGEAKGAIHDFALFKQSGIHIASEILLVGDKGFQGICAIHAFSLLPFKKPRKGILTPEQKVFNSSLSKFRIFIEHVNRRIKCFKILQMRYHNKQRKHLRIGVPEPDACGARRVGIDLFCCRSGSSLSGVVLILLM